MRMHSPEAMKFRASGIAKVVGSQRMPWRYRDGNGVLLRAEEMSRSGPLVDMLPLEWVLHLTLLCSIGCQKLGFGLASPVPGHAQARYPTPYRLSLLAPRRANTYRGKAIERVWGVGGDGQESPIGQVYNGVGCLEGRLTHC